MGIRFYQKPELENPVMIASWPGIGNIGIIAVDTLRAAVMAEEFAEIEPWDFFYPSKVLISKGELKELEFPASKFYFKKTGDNDLIFFIGEEQPTEGGRAYAEGKKAYRMANIVIDVAEEFGCQRIYTSGAAVAAVHHTLRPKVWAVPNTGSIIDELKGYKNTILMSDLEERSGQGNITGLNGLLLGVARRRGLDAVCIMGEIPVYLQGFPIPYPKASKSVLEVLTASLGLDIVMDGIDALAASSENEIERVYEMFPPDIKEQLDKLKQVTYTEPAEPEPITDDDKKRILDDIDKFFKKGPKED